MSYNKFVEKAVPGVERSVSSQASWTIKESRALAAKERERKRPKRTDSRNPDVRQVKKIKTTWVRREEREKQYFPKKNPAERPRLGSILTVPRNSLAALTFRVGQGDQGPVPDEI